MLAVGFFVVAFCYALVGFGGGTSYLALLSISNVSFSVLPKIALICNLIVVTGGCIHFYQKNHFNYKLLLPFVLTSVPMAFIGGYYPITEKTFVVLLTLTLLLAGLRLLVTPTENLSKLPRWPLALFIGSIVGLISGLVGIGGGVFLSPLLMNMRWGRPKEIAAVASSFIFLNSIAGLFGQFAKNPDVGTIKSYWPLFLVVLVGGQIGSALGSSVKVNENKTRKLTGALILFIGCIRLISY
jgi:uncharacterized protein